MYGKVYVGETGRSLGEMVEEHAKSIERMGGGCPLPNTKSRVGAGWIVSHCQHKTKSRDSHSKMLELIHIKHKAEGSHPQLQ